MSLERFFRSIKRVCASFLLEELEADRKGLNTMSNQTEIALPAVDTPTPEKTSWFTLSRCLNGLLIVSVIQLVLAIMLYVLAAVSMIPLLIEAGTMIALALFTHFRGDEGRWPRIFLRVLYLVFLTVILLGSAVLIVGVHSQLVATGDSNLWLLSEANVWMTLAILVLPSLLFLQPAMAVGAGYRRRFDLAILRVTGILVLILSVLLCVFALEFQMYEQPMILTSVTYTPVFFGQETIINIAIDNILTRILFCLCSVAFVVFSFMVRSVPSPSKAEKRARH